MSVFLFIISQKTQAILLEELEVSRTPPKIANKSPKNCKQNFFSIQILMCYLEKSSWRKLVGKKFNKINYQGMDSLKAPSLSSLLSGTDRGSSDSLLGSLNFDLDDVNMENILQIFLSIKIFYSYF